MGRKWEQELSESSWSSEIVSDLEDDDKVLVGLTKSGEGVEWEGQLSWPMEMEVYFSKHCDKVWM